MSPEPKDRHNAEDERRSRAWWTVESVELFLAMKFSARAALLLAWSLISIISNDHDGKFCCLTINLEPQYSSIMAALYSIIMFFCKPDCSLGLFSLGRTLTQQFFQP